MIPKPPIKGAKYSNDKWEYYAFVSMLALLAIVISISFYAILTTPTR